MCAPLGKPEHHVVVQNALNALLDPRVRRNYFTSKWSPGNKKWNNIEDAIISKQRCLIMSHNHRSIDGMLRLCV
jgi:hypothetical protein